MTYFIVSILNSVFLSFLGRILNRFSKDMGAIDEMLPAALMDCIQVQ